MAEGQQYGGFWARLVALVLDNAIVFLILLASLLGLATMIAVLGLAGPAELLAWAVFTFVPFLYWPVMESSRWRATVGKRVMGLEVADADGDQLSFVHALARALAKIVSSIPLGVGFLIAAFTARKQALHDLIAKTLVLRTGPSQLWKVLLALVVGLILMAAAAAGLFYYVLLPMYHKQFSDAFKVEMQGQARTNTQRAQASPPRSPAAAPAPAQTPAATPAAAAPQAGAAAPLGKEGPDAEFDAVAGTPLSGLEKPGTTRAGPALLEISTLFPASLWIKVYLPMPALGDPTLLPAPIVSINRVLDSGGKDYHDPDSNFEKDVFFRRASLRPAGKPVPHLAGTRNVHLKPGLSEQALQKVEGQISITVPVQPRSLQFEAKDTGREVPLHTSGLTLQSISGNVARLRFRGASEHLLVVRGYGADGKPLAVDSRQILPTNRDVDQDFTVTFKGPPAKVEIEVAAKLIERVFPFSLARGAVAGPPSTAANGTTLPQRARTAKAAPAATAPAPVTAPSAAPSAAKPAPVPEPQLKPIAIQPAAPAARPPVVPAARPAAPARAAPAPERTLGPSAACVFKPVMTDEEIARCR